MHNSLILGYFITTLQYRIVVQDGISVQGEEIAILNKHINIFASTQSPDSLGLAGHCKVHVDQHAQFVAQICNKHPFTGYSSCKLIEPEKKVDLTEFLRNYFLLLTLLQIDLSKKNLCGSEFLVFPHCDFHTAAFFLIFFTFFT